MTSVRSAPLGLANTREHEETPALQVVDRTELLTRLDRARGGRVSVIQAPAGYGKSQLLLSWSHQLRQQNAAVAWPDINEELADPARFLAAIIVAVADATSTGSPSATGGQQTASPRFAGRRLAGILQKSSMPLVIIIDDYHRVTSDELDSIMSELVRTLPSHVHWVFVSRTQLRIPFGVLWCNTNVSLFGQKDLRLSDAEIAEVFEHQLVAEDLARISVWTEGWPVAVQLARHYLATHPQDDRDLDTLLSQADGDVGRYLMDQVLRSLPEPHRELLIQSSFLGEFGVDLIEAVTDIKPAWLILQELQNSNVLIAPVDGTEGSYRCHHLLREMMFGQLRRRGRAELTRLQLAAARWFERNGQLREALRHAAAAGDFDLAGRLILDAGGIFYGVRYGAPALQLLMNHLPPEVVSDHPRLSLAQLLVLAKEGRLDVGAGILRAVKLRYRDLLSSRKRAADPLLVRDVAMAELMIAVYVELHFSPSSIAALENAVRDAPPEAFWLHGILYNILCITRYRASDFRGALAAADTAHHYYGQAHSSNGVGHMHLRVGLIDLETGDPIAALGHYQAGRTSFETGLCGDEAGCAIADVLMAEALYEQGRLEESRGLCSAALEVAEAGENLYEFLVAGYRTLTALVAAEEGPQAAMRLLGRGLTFSRRRRFVELERFLTLRRVELQIETGEYPALAAGASSTPGRILRSHHGNNIVPWREQDLQDLLDARLALHLGESSLAIDALEQQQARLAIEGRIRNRVHALIHLALAYDAEDNRPKALEQARTAIGLSLSGGLTMPFVEQGRRMMPMLAQLVTISGPNAPDAAECEFIKRALRISSGLGTSTTSVFSHRELEIVRLLVNGTDNKVIARSLGISPETVRFHLKSIYEKFGVSDRRIVGVLARERGLLD